MSSRSNGVTNVAFTRLAISWVVSSASCSASRMRFGDVLAVDRFAEQFGEDGGTLDQTGGRLGEQCVERVVHRLEAQGHR